MKFSAKNLIGQTIEFIDLFGGKSVINQDFPGCYIIRISVRIYPGKIGIRYGYFQKGLNNFISKTPAPKFGQKHISNFCFSR